MIRERKTSLEESTRKFTVGSWYGASNCWNEVIFVVVTTHRTAKWHHLKSEPENIVAYSCIPKHWSRGFTVYCVWTELTLMDAEKDTRKLSLPLRKIVRVRVDRYYTAYVTDVPRCKTWAAPSPSSHLVLNARLLQCFQMESFTDISRQHGTASSSPPFSSYACRQLLLC